MCVDGLVTLVTSGFGSDTRHTVQFVHGTELQPDGPPSPRKKMKRSFVISYYHRDTVEGVVPWQ